MKLLILGGTAFLGRAVAEHARQAGHNVTCVARGSAPAPLGVTLVRADRDDDDGLAAVSGEHWDAVVDVTRQPGHARRAVRDVSTDHWVFVSSCSVYARFDSPEQCEDAPLLDALDGDVMPDVSFYGQAKVACENHFRDTGRATIIRSGLIGGFGDHTGRTGYYPWRFAHPTGPDVLVPPDLEFPSAMIDVEDLAAWILQCATAQTIGTFNATGPTTTLGAVLDDAAKVAGGTARARAVPADILADAGVSAWMGPASLPLWVDDPDWRWFATLDTTAAAANGLRIRPMAQTLASALRYEEERTQPRAAGLSDADEQALRARLP